MRFSPGWWLGAVSMGLVMLLVYRDLENAAPGPLSATHAQDPALTSADGCALCHGSEREALTLACIECHAAVGAQVDGGRGFHREIEGAADCGRCHLEHEGADFRLVNEHAFDLAGVPDRDEYAHAGLGLGLAGAHARLACSSCHPNADVELLAAGTQRFLGLTASCVGCHADPHEGEMSQDCESCHGQERPFAEVASFDHVARFPLAEAHAGIACAECHAPGTDDSIDAVLDPAHARGTDRACEDCHASPHAATFLAQLGAGAQACSTCHSAVHGGFAETTSMEPALHAATAFPLVEPHLGVECAACHSPAPETDFAQRHPGRKADDCAACHADPHADQFAQARCVSCHTTFFEPHGFDLARHARTAFPLTGKHESTGCHECHVIDSGPAGIRAFSGTPDACEACHADAHAGAFDELGPPSNPAASGCARCHTTGGFDRGARTSFEHDKWTRFPLAGAHASADCESCHTPAQERDALGRLFGRAHEVFPGPVGRCDTCHADAHTGAFDRVGDASCERCHDQSSFREVDRRGGVDHPGFDHGAWTGFALDGSHASAACSTCHPDAATPDAFGRRFGRAPAVSSEQCSTCHADPHGGVFGADDGATDCAACHTTSAFGEVPRDAFDHGARAGFPLLGAHERASCTSCHAERPADVHGRTFGPAAGTSCADCHADPHAAQFARGADGVTDCARCHTSLSDFHVLTFDHALDARFALDDVHARLDCAACHKPWNVASGAVSVRYRPLGTACADCHEPGGGK